MNERKLFQKNGITLIALVISIIVMLILAGVSLNATIGDNGIITKAQEAKLAQERAKIREDLEYMFLDYNIDDNNQTIYQFLDEKIGKEIDGYSTYSVGGVLRTVIEKDGNFYYIVKDGEYYKATEMNNNLDNITEGITVVTKENFDKSTGTMSFNPGENKESILVFYEEVEGDLNFNIESGIVTINVTQNMTLTNQGMSRSAIDIASGATLNLFVEEGKTITVDSGYGVEGVTGDALGALGGEGGYAGIHLPEGATLNLYGTGTLIAYGGDAGNGGGSTTGNRGGGGGRRSWSWYWWKWRKRRSSWNNFYCTS